jgi:hypothetical protein
MVIILWPAFSGAASYFSPAAENAAELLHGGCRWWER